MDSDPALRNLFGVAQVNPALARDGIRIRQFGQQTIEILGGKRIHPGWVVPGGVSEALTSAKRDAILASIPEVQAIAVRTLEWYKHAFDKFQDEIDTFATSQACSWGWSMTTTRSKCTTEGCASRTWMAR